MKTLIVKLDGNYVTDIKALNFPSPYTTTAENVDEDVPIVINASDHFTPSAYYEDYECDEDEEEPCGVDYYIYINTNYKEFFEAIDRVHVEDLRRTCNNHGIALLTDGTKRIEL